MESYKFEIAGAISPKIEMGAYEALWDRVSSFKQVRDTLTSSHVQYASQLVDEPTSDRYYNLAMERLSKANIQKFGIRIEGTHDYPSSLKDADHPLHLFYYQGSWDLASSPGVSVVGSRNPSSEGIKRAAQITKKLVEYRYTVFSGLADGIDTVAHRTALEAGGNTVAVIGTPLSHSYPAKNKELQKLIAENFLLVSQVPIVRYEQNGPDFNRFFFPERNKTMSALTRATIIVEAGETSGTLIQARAALKQGRKLFILNSCFENAALTWPAKYEKEGAIRVRNFEDIAKELPIAE